MVATTIIEKKYFSYNQIHDLLRKAVLEDKLFKDFQPTLILAIGTGGFVPARILRTFLKLEFGRTLPVQAIILNLYEDECAQDVSKLLVRKTQWLSDISTLEGHNILVVDEVDDTRKTLQYAIAELQKDIDTARAEREANGGLWRPTRLGTFVVHNKKKAKLGHLPHDIESNSYFYGDELEDRWVVYPWDAVDSFEHTKLAEA